jgi:hypothetical protein
VSKRKINNKNKEMHKQVYEGHVDPSDYPNIFYVILTLLFFPLGIIFIFTTAKDKPFSRKWYTIAIAVGFFMYLLIVAFIFLNKSA